MPTIIKTINKAYNDYKLIDEILVTHDNADITIRPRPQPAYAEIEVSHVDLTQASLDAIITAHDSNVLTDEQKETALADFTRTQVIVYFRTELASAAGNGAAIATLYTQARAYEQQNQILADTMLTLRAIEETALGLSSTPTTNQDKARYLKLFLMALALWS